MPPAPTPLPLRLDAGSGTCGGPVSPSSGWIVQRKSPLAIYLAFISALDLGGIIAFGVLVVIPILITGRKLHLDIKGVHATVDERGVEAISAATEAKEAAADTKATIGAANGNGDLMTMQARQLAELAEIRAELDLRTHVIRTTTGETVELGPYIQTWFHEINTLLTIIKGKQDVMWNAIKEDYNLPDMPTESKEEGN